MRRGASRPDQARSSPAPAGGARARRGGSPQSRGPREQALPQAPFIFNTPGTQRCSPSLPMREVRLRVRQLPKRTQNPGAQAPGPLLVIPGTCMCGQVLAGQGPRGAGVRAPLFWLSPWGFPPGAPKEGPVGAWRHVSHACSPVPHPPAPPGHTALGPAAVGIPGRGSPLPSVDTLGWSLPAVWSG